MLIWPTLQHLPYTYSGLFKALLGLPCSDLPYTTTPLRLSTAKYGAYPVSPPPSRLSLSLLPPPPWPRAPQAARPPGRPVPSGLGSRPHSHFPQNLFVWGDRQIDSRQTTYPIPRPLGSRGNRGSKPTLYPSRTGPMAGRDALASSRPSPSSLLQKSEDHTKHPYAAPRRRGRPKLGKSRRRTAYPQQIVTTRLLYCLQDRFAQLSRLQRI